MDASVGQDSHSILLMSFCHNGDVVKLCKMALFCFFIQLLLLVARADVCRSSLMSCQASASWRTDSPVLDKMCIKLINALLLKISQYNFFDPPPHSYKWANHVHTIIDHSITLCPVDSSMQWPYVGIPTQFPSIVA